MTPRKLSHTHANLTLRLLSAALLLFAPAAAFAQEGWSVVSSCVLERDKKAGGSKVTTITFLDDRRGVLGGDAGLIRFTQNGGISWRRPVTPPDFKDDVQRITASGDDLLLVAYKSLLISRDGGRVWRAVKLPYPAEYVKEFGNGVNIDFYDGTLSRNEVRVLGAAYNARGFDSSFFLKFDLTDETPNPYIRKLNPVDPTTEFFRLFFYNESYGWVVGSKGGILKTIDGGIGWSPPLYDPIAAPQQPGGVSALFDSGQGQPAGQTKKPALLGVFFIDQLKGWAVGEKGITLRTSDGGGSWDYGSVTAANPAVRNADFTQVQFLDNQNGWAVGSKGAVIKTTDGGHRWDDVFPPKNVTQTLFAIGMWKGPGVWVVGAGDVLLRHDEPVNLPTPSSKFKGHDRN